MTSKPQQAQAAFAALMQAAHAILDNDSFMNAARAIFAACKELLGASAGYIALLKADGTENEVLFLDAGGLPCTVNPLLPMPIRGLRETACRLKQTVYENSFADSEWVRYLPAGHARLENVLFAPLILNDKTVGILGLANKRGGGWLHQPGCGDSQRL